MFDKQAYLTRIKVHERPPSISYLKELIRGHVMNIPFENLDIYYKKRIRLNIEDFFKKLINEKRGGYCFELNALFFHLLIMLGFQTELLHGSFYKKETKKFSHDFDHMMIRVTIGEVRYLVDVGMIVPMVTPIKWEMNQANLIGSEYYRLTEKEASIFLLQKSSDASVFSTFLKIYNQPVTMIEFLSMNDTHQEDPNSFFVQNRVVSIVTKQGRREIKNNEIIIQELGSESRKQILNEDEFFTLLGQHFGLDARHLTNPEA
jgi:N-hydroxyarylamine O-acetyltransferase